MDMSTRIINYCSIIFGVTMGAIVGFVIYRKTMKRAKELEIEELEASRGELGGDPGRPYGDFSEDADVTALMSDDDISLWNQDRHGFRDDSTNGSDEEIFSRGEMDVEAAKNGSKPR